MPLGKETFECRFIGCNKHTLWWDVYNGGGGAIPVQGRVIKKPDFLFNFTMNLQVWKYKLKAVLCRHSMDCVRLELLHSSK